MNQKRPKHLALHKIKLPLPGIVSILHRISGVLLFLLLPLLLWMLQQSLRSIEGHTMLANILSASLVKVVLTGVAWAFNHHLCAGIRYLLVDLHLIHDLSRARSSSVWVMVCGLLLTAMTGVWIW